MVIRDILCYLIAHPDAKDTAQGILRWWLSGDRLGWEEGAVQEALDMLVARGWLTQRQVTSSPTVYGLSKEHIEEILAFLGEFGNTAEGPRT
jgi:hypothetical protein